VTDVDPDPDPEHGSETDGGGSGSDADADPDPDRRPDVPLADRRYHVDGRLVPASDASVGVHDRGLTLADAAVEVVRAYGGVPFALDTHLARLARVCDALSIPAPPRSDLTDRVRATLDANPFGDALVRLSVTRGPARDRSRALPARDRAAPTVVVTADPLPRGGRSGTRAWTDPATVATVDVRPVPDDAVPSAAATHARLDRVRARRALPGDVHEALLVDAAGEVRGGAGTDLLFVAGNALHVRRDGEDDPAGARATRRAVTSLASEEGIPVRRGRHSPSDVRDADEVLLVGPRTEVRPVARVDDAELDRGPVTRLLARLFDERVERACYEAPGDDGTSDDDGDADADGDDHPPRGDDGDGGDGPGRA
jgi:branched-chain amino acid aminotransferase